MGKPWKIGRGMAGAGCGLILGAVEVETGAIRKRRIG